MNGGSSHADAEQETIQGIADYLQRENPEWDKWRCWDEALSPFRVQFAAEVLPPKSGKPGGEV